jgi:hypothetical protein
VHPLLTLVTHDPLLAIVAEVEVDLLAVEAIGLFLVLLDAVAAEVLDVVLAGQFEFGGFVGLADLVAADVRIALGFLAALLQWVLLALLGDYSLSWSTSSEMRLAILAKFIKSRTNDIALNLKQSMVMVIKHRINTNQYLIDLVDRCRMIKTIIY